MVWLQGEEKDHMPTHYKPSSSSSSNSNINHLSSGASPPHKKGRDGGDGSSLPRSVGESSGWQLRRICERVFSECAHEDDSAMPLDSLHLAILLVYNSVNKQYFSPHKEPPSKREVGDKIKAYSKKADSIGKEDFYELVLEFMRKDLRIVMANKLMLALLTAPSLTAATRRAGSRLPRIGTAVEKVPAPVFFTAYSIGIFFLQDVPMR